MKLHSLGEQLRAARIKKELSLYDVEKFSGVEAQFLLAMEMDQLKALPEDIQQEALEKYATSVGLDGQRLFEEQRQNEQKLKKEKKPVERKEDTLAAKAPMSRFLKHKREEKRKSNYLPLLILSAVSFYQKNLKSILNFSFLKGGNSLKYLSYLLKTMCHRYLLITPHLKLLKNLHWRNQPLVDCLELSL